MHALDDAKTIASDNVNTFIYNMNFYIFSLRSNAQNHFDSSVRTLTESLRVYMNSANRANYVVIGDNRTALQECIVNTRETLLDVLDSLKNSANSPIFDYTVATETQIELDLQTQTDELKAAIDATTNSKCLAAIGINPFSLGLKYQKFSSSITTCVFAQQIASNTQIIVEFNPEHYPALTLLNSAGYSLGIARTREQLLTFVSDHVTF